jgi:hypothetical protein
MLRKDPFSFKQAGIDSHLFAGYQYARLIVKSNDRHFMCPMLHKDSAQTPISEEYLDLWKSHWVSQGYTQEWCDSYIKAFSSMYLVDGVYRNANNSKLTFGGCWWPKPQMEIPVLYAETLIDSDITKEVGLEPMVDEEHFIDSPVQYSSPLGLLFVDIPTDGVNYIPGESNANRAISTLIRACVPEESTVNGGCGSLVLKVKHFPEQNNIQCTYCYKAHYTHAVIHGHGTLIVPEDDDTARILNSATFQDDVGISANFIAGDPTLMRWYNGPELYTYPRSIDFIEGGLAFDHLNNKYRNNLTLWKDAGPSGRPPEFVDFSMFSDDDYMLLITPTIRELSLSDVTNVEINMVSVPGLADSVPEYTVYANGVGVCTDMLDALSRSYQAMPNSPDKEAAKVEIDKFKADGKAKVCRVYTNSANPPFRTSAVSLQNLELYQMMSDGEKNLAEEEFAKDDSNKVITWSQAEANVRKNKMYATVLSISPPPSGQSLVEKQKEYAKDPELTSSEFVVYRDGVFCVGEMIDGNFHFTRPSLSVTEKLWIEINAPELVTEGRSIWLENLQSGPYNLDKIRDIGKEYSITSGDTFDLTLFFDNNFPSWEHLTEEQQQRLLFITKGATSNINKLETQFTMLMDQTMNPYVS